MWNIIDYHMVPWGNAYYVRPERLELRVRLSC